MSIDSTKEGGMKRFDEEEFFDESMGVVERFGILAGYHTRKKAMKIIGIMVIVLAVVIFSLIVFPRAFLHGARKNDKS